MAKKEGKGAKKARKKALGLAATAAAAAVVPQTAEVVVQKTEAPEQITQAPRVEVPQPKREEYQKPRPLKTIGDMLKGILGVGTVRAADSVGSDRARLPNTDTLPLGSVNLPDGQVFQGPFQSIKKGSFTMYDRSGNVVLYTNGDGRYFNGNGDLVYAGSGASVSTGDVVRSGGSPPAATQDTGTSKASTPGGPTYNSPRTAVGSSAQPQPSTEEQHLPTSATKETKPAAPIGGYFEQMAPSSQTEDSQAKKTPETKTPPMGGYFEQMAPNTSQTKEGEKKTPPMGGYFEQMAPGQTNVYGSTEATEAQEAIAQARSGTPTGSTGIGSSKTGEGSWTSPEGEPSLPGPGASMGNQGTITEDASTTPEQEAELTPPAENAPDPFEVDQQNATGEAPASGGGGSHEKVE